MLIIHISHGVTRVIIKITVDPCGKVYEDISKQGVIRASYYTTRGLLVQSCRYVTVRNCIVGYAPGTGLRVQSSDFVTVEGNTVHNSSRRSSVGNHGMVIHSVANNVNGLPSVADFDGYRVQIIGNTVHHNYNEVYSWSSLKTFISPHIDEGKGITVQKTKSNFDNGTGRILIANNVVYYNGFSGVHTNFATKTDIYHNTAIENTFSGRGVNCGISVSDSARCNVMNNIAYSANTHGCSVYGTDINNLANKEIVFSNNLAVGELSNKLSESDFIMSTAQELLLQSAPDYRVFSGSSAEGQGDPSVLTTVPLDKDDSTRPNPPDLGAFNVDNTPTTSAPTRLTAAPSQSPSETPTQTPTRCEDNPDPFKSKNGKNRRCAWAGKNDNFRIKRCKFLNVSENCPVTCGSRTQACIGDTNSPSQAPSRCTDNPDPFKSANNKNRRCKWALKKRKKRCKKLNVSKNCPLACQNPGC